jgi:hypothetical protein
MPNESLMVFTAKSTERILREGGTSSWRLNRNHARKCSFVVCTRNTHAEWGDGIEPHHSAFLIGKIKDVVPSPREEGDWLIQFSEYSLLSVPEVWKGDRNPVRYVSLDQLKELGVDTRSLKWEPMPAAAAISESGPRTVRPGTVALSMLEAKRGLAMTFGVAPEAIEITIRG